MAKNYNANNFWIEFFYNAAIVNGFLSALKKNRPGPDRLSDLNIFLPIFQNADSLALVSMQGFEIGFKTIQTALTCEAKMTKTPRLIKIESTHASHSHAVITCSREKALVVRAYVPELYWIVCRQVNTGGADPKFFSRCKNNPDGLMYFCKACHDEMNRKRHAERRATER